MNKWWYDDLCCQWYKLKINPWKEIKRQFKYLFERFGKKHTFWKHYRRCDCCKEIAIYGHFNGKKEYHWCKEHCPSDYWDSAFANK